MVFMGMLIQYDYRNGNYSLIGGALYYKDLKIAEPELKPLMSAGSDEVYLIHASSYTCGYRWLVIVQSGGYPVFYEASLVELDKDKMDVELMNGHHVRIQVFECGYPHEDTDYKKLLVDTIYQ